MIALAVDLCNSVAVTLFGIALSAAFCNIHWTPKAKKRMLLYTLMIFCLSGIAYLGVDPGFGRYLYPLHTHLPLVLALCSLSHERLWPVISVLTAYLCCQLRRWLALIAVAIFSGGDTMQYAVEMIVTVPLLILLLKTAPAIRSVSQYSRAVQCQFGIVPAVYYAFDYATRVYTDLLFSGSAVVVEFMPFVCSAAYLLFLIHISREQHARLHLEELKSNLDLQVHQAVREIEALRISQQKTRTYRHDLRHHLQYITACIENKQYEQALQKKELKLPEFPTTTIGSFPQTKDVKANRSAFRRGEISKEEYVAFNKKKIADCVKWQEEIGLDVLVHGEYERNDMVEYFGEALGGFLFTEKAWVQSYGTRCVKPPIIWGDVYRDKPITVEWSVYAQSQTDKIMKGMLTGPVTILNWSFPREDISIKESISQIALAIRDEVLDLEANGIRMIQIDEAALREKLPLRRSDWYDEYLDFAIPAFRLTHSGVKADTQIHTHMCYSEFTDIIPAIDDMDADVITFEASRSDLQILDALRENHFETEVGPGVYDIHSPRVPSVEEMVQALRLMLTKIEPEKLWVNPDCGLKTRGVPETDASLRNMVEAAKQIRQQ